MALTSTPDFDAPRTINEAARALGVCRWTVYALIRRGKLRSYKVGRARRTRDSWIRDCIEQLTVVTTNT